ALPGNSKQVAFTPTVPLPVSNQSYTWRVRPRDAANRPGQWTDLADPSARFRVVGSAPSLTAPQDETLVVGRDSLFSWTGVDGATDYRWEMRLQSGGGSTSVRTPALAWAPSIIGNGNWEWRVVSLNSAGVEIGSSPWWQFKVDTLRPAVSSAKPVGLVKRGSNFYVTFSEPVRDVKNTTFKITPVGSRRALTAKVTRSSSRLRAVLNPSRDLRRGKSYVIKLTGGIKDDASNKLVPFQWTVTSR
ncbi:MAG: Ig-like domain-containing protein, partial [Nocardioides sp.]